MFSEHDISSNGTEVTVVSTAYTAKLPLELWKSLTQEQKESLIYSLSRSIRPKIITGPMVTTEKPRDKEQWSNDFYSTNTADTRHKNFDYKKYKKTLGPGYPDYSCFATPWYRSTYDSDDFGYPDDEDSLPPVYGKT